ncbi:hypothetical protein OAJ94_00115 [Deltaproteobacteria bacterium]|nr:hypothetical protein [Deltaproteobacteria bacterium]
MDLLSVFDGLSACPLCGTLQKSGMSRCPECGTFNTSTQFEERPIPHVEDRIKTTPADPTQYSLNPNIEIPIDDNVEVEDMTTSWGGGNTNFGLGDDEIDTTRDVDLKSLNIPSAETLFEEE